MSIRSSALALLAAASFSFSSAQAQVPPPPPAPDGHPHHFTADGDHFALDGKPFQIISGAIHYTRIPREYWRDRLRKAKAMGLNTIETYAFWNVTEPQPGVFDFSGQNDITEFIQEAQQEGLYVILRPGPYVCAEWEFGGYPSWLLKDPRMVVRTSYPGFMQAAEAYLSQLAKHTVPLQIGNGGPIIAVQVENEYGSFGSDHAYMEQVHKALINVGYTKSLLYTADGADQVPAGSLPELPVAINFGEGEARKAFATLEKIRPDSIRFNSEYWDGWFDHWGHKHETRSDAAQLADLDWMLSRGYSVNLYMFAGGTSFGWMNGANSNGTNYEPDVTSYDYDVPVAESGELRPKYYQFRDLITRLTKQQPPAPPAPVHAAAIASVTFTDATPLWINLPQPTHAAVPLTMEAIGQSYGYILYRTHLPSAPAGTLALPGLHDYAQVYIDGTLQGTVDRRLGQSSLALPAAGNPAGKSRATLDILLENTGRVNFGKRINEERTGLLEPPTIDNKPINPGWDIYSLPMLTPDKLTYTQQPCTGACFFNATVHIDTPADTFLDTGKLGKGMVWINGRPLGRFWNIGPQQTLYLPAPFLHAGDNTLTIFDLKGSSTETVEGKTAPILDGPVKDE